MKYSINTITLAIISTIYIIILNSITYHSFKDLYYVVPIAILFFVLLLIFRLFGKIVFKLAISAFIFLASIAIFFKWRYGVVITSDIILSGLINNRSLTAEMISINLIIWVFVTAIVPIVIIIFINIKKVNFFTYFKSIVASFVLVFLLLYIQGYHYRAKGQIREYKTIYAIENFSPVDVIYNYRVAKRELKTIQKEYKDTKVDIKDYTSEYNNSLVVIIIGETSRGDRFGINGYNKNTNPNLSKLSNLYSFKNAKSCDTLTINSMHYIFSKRECKEYNPTVKGAAFTQIFKALGYKIDIYSLQGLDAFYRYLGYDKLIGKYQIVKEQQVGTKDIALLPYLKKDINSYKGGKKIIIAHTLGSHQTYADRLSKRYIKFKPICKNADVKKCKKANLDNTFDDTIVAVDDFLYQTINILKDKNAMLVYFSDHGESLGENGIYFHGAPVKSAPKEQFDVPIMFWFSNKYKKRAEYKNFVANFNKFKGLNITHDYLYHSILGCGGIKSKNIKKSLNMCKNNQNLIQ